MARSSQIELLKPLLSGGAGRGAIYFEYAIPRLGKRIDAVLILDHILYVLEFKIGEQHYTRAGIDQAWDYALDLKHFHEPSHPLPVVPVLIATRAPSLPISLQATAHQDKLLQPIKANAATLAEALAQAARHSDGPPIDWQHWQSGRYLPTPTIVEAAAALYAMPSPISRAAMPAAVSAQCVSRAADAGAVGDGDRGAGRRCR
jgi:hypothetical protein